jgi:2'-5' RNA ligase
VIRSFVAISIPDTILERIEESISDLRDLGLEARFSKVQSIHLTLKFLGNVNQERIPLVVTALQEGVQEASSFALTVHELGVFPNLRKPRVVWAGIEQDQRLTALQQRVEACLQPLGFEAERRSFHPHLTLARLKSRRNLSALLCHLEGVGETFHAGRFGVEEIHLFQSILRPEGAQYHRLASFPLVGASGQG